MANLPAVLTPFFEALAADGGAVTDWAKPCCAVPVCAPQLAHNRAASLTWVPQFPQNLLISSVPICRNYIARAVPIN